MARRRIRAFGLALTLATASMTCSVTAAVAAAPLASCRTLDVPVPAEVTDHQLLRLAGTATEPWTIHGELCQPSRGPAPATVLLAMHGITYSHRYWNPGYQPQRYSFARAMAAAGYATFAADRLGYGRSSHPVSALVSLDSAAQVAHELISQLRAGAIGGSAFRRVVLVGHSYGAAIAWRESALYNDADAMIGTAWASTIQTDPVVRFISGFYPAAADPAFAERNLDPGYLTARPGERDRDFLYDRSNVDPAMLTYDEEQLRDTLSVAEGSVFKYLGALPVGPIPSLGTTVEIPNDNQTKAVRIPTFLANGAEDLLTCGPDGRHCTSSEQLTTAEGAYFSPAACFRAAVVPHAGHDLNLQRNAPDAFAQIRQWLDETVDPDGSKLAGYRARCASRPAAQVSDRQL